jgi:putative phosphoesterase
LISDTHGLLRPEATSFLAGCAHILHAGDIGYRDILDQLAAIAPVSAVRGNNDRGAWAAGLTLTNLLAVGSVRVWTIHDLAQLDIDPGATGIRVVVSGHSHIPKIREEDGVLYVNPGSAGPRRFRLPISIGELEIDGDSVVARLADL